MIHSIHQPFFPGDGLDVLDILGDFYNPKIFTIMVAHSEVSDQDVFPLESDPKVLMVLLAGFEISDNAFDHVDALRRMAV